MPKQAPLEIHKTTVAPGDQAVVKIPIGRLPSGNQIHIEAHVYHAEEPGPAVLVLAGMHGDEVNGVEIVRRSLQEGLFEGLLRGTVIAVPVLNVYGFINFSREVPDGKDVNRSFPGSKQGSLASRVAGALTREVLPKVGMAVDFHTGGRSLHNYPQIRYTQGDPLSEKLAQAFDAPFSIAKATIPRSFRRVALQQQKPTLVFEGGESLRYDAFAIAQGLAGLQRLLVAQRMLPEAIIPPPPFRLHFNKLSWQRAPRAGMFRWVKAAGQSVEKGETIGFVNNPYGGAPLPIAALRTGFIIGHNNAPVVNQGDALFHIGYEEDTVKE